MSDYNLILASLKVYPSLRQIKEASRYSEEITAEYVRKIDPNAVIIIDDGDIDIFTDSDFKDLRYHAQYIFEEAFADMIEKIQHNRPIQVLPK